ncbi:hypothetical protein IWW50_006327, partial [Coemansia erecta]
QRAAVLCQCRGRASALDLGRCASVWARQPAGAGCSSAIYAAAAALRRVKGRASICKQRNANIRKMYAYLL